MVYVPAFIETFLVLVLALGVLVWVRQRNPAAGLAVPVLIGGVMLPTLWGAFAVWGADVDTVAIARFSAMGVALLGLLMALAWALAVWGQPLAGDDGETPPKGDG